MGAPKRFSVLPAHAFCDMFGRELKGERFLSLWDARSHRDICMLLDHMAEDTQGFVAGVNGGRDDGQPVALELLMLPLYPRRHRGSALNWHAGRIPAAHHLQCSP